jgi:hypothetical protein
MNEELSVKLIKVFTNLAFLEDFASELRALNLTKLFGIQIRHRDVIKFERDNDMTLMEETIARMSIMKPGSISAFSLLGPVTETFWTFDPLLKCDWCSNCCRGHIICHGHCHPDTHR